MFTYYHDGYYEKGSLVFYNKQCLDYIMKCIGYVNPFMHKLFCNRQKRKKMENYFETDENNNKKNFTFNFFLLILKEVF